MSVHRSPDASNSAPQSKTLMCLLGFHAFIDVLMLWPAWVFNVTVLTVMFSILSAQSSLVAMWAALAHAPRWSRFLLAPLAIMISLILMAKLLSWGVGSSESIDWVVSLLVQTLSIIIVLSIARRGWSFNLQALSYTIVVAAMMFAFIRGAQIYWNWTIESLTFAAMATHVSAGVGSTIVACAGAFAVLKQVNPSSQSIMTKTVVRWLAAIFAVLIVVIVFHLIVEGIYGKQTLSIAESLTFFGTQSVCIGLTLVCYRGLRFRID